MASTVVYDSGAGGLPANEWGAYSVSVEPIVSVRPREVAISLEPLNTPEPGWNLAGWACLEHEQDSFRYNCSLTAVGLLPAISGLPYSVLTVDGVTRASGNIVGFRAVRWNIHRWIGPCRVRVLFFR